MQLHRIYAIIYRHLLLFKRDFYRTSDILYWPAMEIFIWGITSSYIRSFTEGLPNILLIIMSGVLFWLIVNRAQNDISVGVLEELWNKNLINLFVSPLKFYEWITALIILSIIKILLAFSFAAVLAAVLYELNIFIYGFYLLPFMVLLLMTSWWVAFIVNTFILKYGTKIGILAWSAIMLLSPFSAIYYPVSVLPQWAQTIAALVPTSYVFEGAREVINTGILDMQKVYISFLLSGLYLLVAILFLRNSFYKLLDKGLAKIY